MKKKKAQLLKQILMITFLALIVLGFTVPGFLQSNSVQDSGSGVIYAEPRLCTADSDCYLDCGSLPVRVFCSGNLCQQNSCEEGTPYPYRENPLSFTLTVDVEGDRVDPVLRASASDYFVTYEEDSVVNVFSYGLTLAQVLEKARILYGDNCLYVDSESYCSDEDKGLILLVNGEESLERSLYSPQQGDVIEVVYS